jgi:histone acetyltransferase (RNA polymerase elongator complex component)
MDERVLSTARRGHSVSETERAIERLKKLNYEIGAQLMVGLPGDTPERSIASALRVAQLKPDFIRIYPTVVLAGSPLAAWYRNGKYIPLSLEEAVRQVMNLYQLFKKKNIAVIRMGLQASEDLENSSKVLAGPYHPAFGHLVYSEISLDMAVAQIESSALNTDSISIHVNSRNVSNLRGLRNRNIEILKKKFNFETVAVKPDDTLAQDQIKVSSIPSNSK